MSNERIENGLKIIEYENPDGSITRIETPYHEPSEEDIPVPEPIQEPTTNERIEQLQMDNMILLMALTDIYTDLQTLKGGE